MMGGRLGSISVLPILLAGHWMQPVRADFTGTWVFDATRSADRSAADRLVVIQSADTITLRRALCCRQAGEEWITTYHFNEWGPRGATPLHTSPTTVRVDRKPTQARWDGDALLLHAGPELDRLGGSLHIWRLSADRRLLLEEVIHRGLGLAFDFKEASIPTMYARDRHVYVRQ